MTVLDARTKEGRESDILNMVRERGENGLAYWIFDNSQYRTALERLEKAGRIIIDRDALQYPYWVMKVVEAQDEGDKGD